MLGAALIVSRDTLEAALIIAVVLGATRGLAGRWRWVSAGIGGGVLGAVVIALFAGTIGVATEGAAHDLFDATVLLAAVAMLGWHNIWMSSHGRELAMATRAVGHQVERGARPLSAIAVVTALAVLREGSEAVLFLFGLGASGVGAPAMIGGIVLGVGIGVAIGSVLYFGLVAIPVQRFFAAISWVVLVLAGGLAANAAGYLVDADVLPALGSELWNTSWLIGEEDWLGRLLHVLVGYNERPSGVQIAFFAAAIAGIYSLMHTVGRRGTSSPASAASETRGA